MIANNTRTNLLFFNTFKIKSKYNQKVDYIYTQSTNTIYVERTPDNTYIFSKADENIYVENNDEINDMMTYMSQTHDQLTFSGQHLECGKKIEQENMHKFTLCEENACLNNDVFMNIKVTDLNIYEQPVICDEYVNVKFVKSLQDLDLKRYEHPEEKNKICKTLEMAIEFEQLYGIDITLVFTVMDCPDCIYES